MIHILNHFNIITHVFCLIFMDSLFSTWCAGISTVLDLLVLTGIADTSFVVCSFGALLTLIIASVKYILTKKASKNIQPFIINVLVSSLAAFFGISLPIQAYFSVSIWYQIPYMGILCPYLFTSRDWMPVYWTDLTYLI